MPYSIVTDTSANLPQAMAARYGLIVVPLSYSLNGQAPVNCPPVESFDAAAYYDQLRNGAAVQTSLSNTQQYIDTFEPLLRSGQDVLCLTLSGGVSGTCQAASLAARDLRIQYPDRQIFVVDTKGAALGEGLIALYAAQLREQGYALNAALTRLTHKIPHLHQLFTVEDLQYLRRGGRISGITAAVGSMLHIRPLLRGEDGRIVMYGKVRGRKSSINALVDGYVANAKFGGAVAITHADAPEDAQTLEQAILAKDPDARILTATFEPVTGAHAGPGALALFFFGA